jgi:Pregnancy-associated plasma protein-A/Secretion system C-terminal sorting domain
MRKFFKQSVLSIFVSCIGMSLVAQNSFNGTSIQAQPKGSGLQTPAFVPPAHRTCATMDKMVESLQEHPELVSTFNNYEYQMAQLLANPSINKTQGIITVPVVIHVVYRQAAGNISDAQIQSQIVALNADYRRQNADASSTPANFLPAAADCGIEFCLASTDPQGNPTSGVTRVSTTTSNIGSTNTYYTVDPAWDRNKYLNIWVCEIGGGTLGFAYLPGTAPASYDGVVIDYRYFGTTGTAQYPFNKGRTATHEVGHWFNLRHIWGDNPDCGVDDLIGDTPIQGNENYNCPTNAISCSNGGDMSMNYMDYTDDRCMNIFTQGQSARMNAALNGPRASLQSSNGCSGGGGSATACNDTLNFPLAGTPTIYTSDGWGYVGGHNNYLDKSKADYFPNGSGYTTCTGVRLEFGVGYSAGAGSAIDVNIWDDNGGVPGSIIGTTTLLIDDIITAGGLIDVTFPSSVALSGAFYAGIAFDYANSGDTVALISTLDAEVSPGIAWEQFDNGDWFPMTDTTDSWGLTLRQAIYPIVTGAPLNVIVSPINPTILQGNSTVLTASGASTYVWSPATGLSATTGATVTASPTVTTVYTITGTNGACSGTETATVSVTPLAGVSDLFASQNVAVFPNPGNGRFTLQFQSARRGTYHVSVTNTLGQDVYRNVLADFAGSFDGVIDLSGNSAGVYFLRITDGEKQFSRKLVIE